MEKIEKLIQNNLDNPQQLEQLYRQDKTGFKRAFEQLWPDLQAHAVAKIWNERLNYSAEALRWGSRSDLAMVIVLSLFAGLIAKIPDFTGIDPDYFYPRHLGLIVFPALSAYFAWKQSLSIRQIALIATVFILSATYINMLPNNETSDTMILASIHLPLMLWATTAYAFSGKDFNNKQKRIDYLRYNGDLIVMTAVILLAGGLLSAVTVGLFEIIDLSIKEYYFQYVAIWGLSAAPIVATWLVQTNPQLVKNVSPVIAKVFTPLVMVMLATYLIAIVYTGKDPYNDREFLFIFNILLIGVMALILFSLAEARQSNTSNVSLIMLFTLALLTILVNSIALSAIVFRITEFGITPNRLAVLAANLLILINLMMVSWRLFQSLRQPEQLEAVNLSIAAFLPYYAVWTAIVVFLFPVLFGFR